MGILNFSVDPSKSKRIINQLKEICSILAGLVVSSNIKLGKQLIENKNFADNKDWYRNIFEIGRRYKIMNPERMRDTFGKLCYMIMDSMLPQIKDFMEFDFYKPILTIERFIIENDKEKKSLSMFNDRSLDRNCEWLDDFDNHSIKCPYDFNKSPNYDGGVYEDVSE